MKGIAVLAATCAAVAGPAAAQGVTQQWFGPDRCWARTYDAGHLARHRGQQVQRIWMGGTAGDARPQAGEVNIGFRIAGRRGGYSGMAVCRDGGAGVDCGIEGDGGNVRIVRFGDDLRLTIVDRLALEGDSDFSPELGRGQDRVFLLRRSPVAACR